MATWHTPTSARTEWPGASKMTDAVLTNLLEIAQEQIILADPAGGPFAADAETIPARIARAQLRQAQAVHEGARAALPDGSLGMEGQSIPRSADFSASIMRLLFPPRPGIG